LEFYILSKSESQIQNSLDNLQASCNFFSHETEKPRSANDIESQIDNIENPTIYPFPPIDNLVGSSTIINIEDFFPTSLSHGVILRSAFSVQSPSLYIGDFSMVANWKGLSFISQLCGSGKYDSEEGIIGELHVYPGCVPPYWSGPLSATQKCLLGKFSHMMNAQRYRFPTLQIPFFLAYFSDIILRSPIESYAIFSSAPKYKSDLHDVLFKLEYNIPFTVNPSEAGQLILDWLKEIPEPLFPSYFLPTYLLDSSLSAILKALLEIPQTNLKIFFHIIVLCDIIYQKSTHLQEFAAIFGLVFFKTPEKTSTSFSSPVPPRTDSIQYQQQIDFMDHVLRILPSVLMESNSVHFPRIFTSPDTASRPPSQQTKSKNQSREENIRDSQVLIENESLSE